MKLGNFGSAYFGGCFKRTEKPALASTFIVLLLIGVVVAISVSIPIQVASSAGEENSQVLERWTRLNERHDLLRQWSWGGESEPIRAIIRLEPADLTGIEESQVVDALKEHADETQAQVIEFLNTKGANVLNKFWLANAILVEADINTLWELTSFSVVKEIHEDFQIEVPGLIEASEDSSSNVTWGLDRIGAPDVWALGFDGSGIRVAVLDTGVEITHSDLVGKMWTDNPADSTYPGGWIEFDLNGNIVVGSTPYDTDMHGTHTSGTVVGGNASGTAIGVAPGAWLMHGLVLPGGYGSWTQVIAGMQWTLAPFDQYGNLAGEKADVVSMSWGADGYYDEMIEPVRNMKVAGVVPVAAIGNSGEWVSSCPGNVYEAFGIGAMDVYDSAPWWSSGEVVNWQESYPDLYIKPDFSGPGVNVYSSVPGGYYHASGTSMATPHVAGSVALLLSANPALRVDDVYDVLKLTSDDLGDPGKDTRYGWGIVNAYGATVTAVYNSGIEGYVLDAKTLDGIAGAKVVVQEMGWTRPTTENGYYRIFAVPGDYALTVSAFGYYENIVTVSIIENQWITLNIALASTPRGFISGKVMDNAYNSIENAIITLLKTPQSTKTDNEGNYILKVPVGSYDIKASAIGFLPTYARNIIVNENQTTVVNFQLREIKPAPLADTPWPKFRRDVLNTGRSPYLGAQENVLKWRCDDIDDLIFFPVSIGPEGTIYAGGSWYGIFYAISREGLLKWSRNIGGALSIWSSPAISSNNVVHIGTAAGFFSMGELYAFSSEGDVLWIFTDPEKWPILSSPTIGLNGTIYLGTFNGLRHPLEGRFFALNPDGTVKWFYHATTGWIVSSPAISPDNATVYIGTSGYNRGPEWNWESGELYAFYENGQQKWRYTVSGDGVWTSLAIGSDGTIYFGSSVYEKLYAVDENGAFKWSCNVNCGESSPSIGPDGTVYIGSYNKLYAIYPDNGAIKWAYGNVGKIYCSPTVGSDGCIYFTSDDDHLYAINPDGSLKWSHYLPYIGWTDPVIDFDGTIYVGTAETLYAIKGREVSISISPENQSAPPKNLLTYTVTITNSGTIKDTYNLSISDTKGWNPILSENLLKDVQPGENVTVILGVIIPSGTLPGAEDNITVIVTSLADPRIKNSDSCIVHASVGREVGISLVTRHKEGLPGMRLSYRATVMNTGNVEDTYDLTVGDNADWDLSISPTSFTLAPGQSNFVMIDVTIPENAVVGAKDNIVIVATSRENVEVSASARCTARRCEAVFKLENLYNISLGVNFYPQVGSKLIIKFYTYEGDYQAESVVWSGTTPAHIVLSENAAHPQGEPVEIVRLLLADDEGNAVSKVAGFVVSRPVLFERYCDIKMRWPYASEEERIILQAEMDAIKEQWPRAPDKKLVLSLSPSSGGNSPGATFSFSVKVQNMGDFTDVYALTVSDNVGWELTISPTTSTLVAGDSETITLGVTVPLGTPIGTEDLVTITATSMNDPGISAGNSCTAHAVFVNVQLLISPSHMSDLPGLKLRYTVAVSNVGEVQDAYDLTVDDNLGWELALSENLLEDVQPGENRVVTLRVTIPSGTEKCVEDNVIVTATSQLDPRVNASASCIGHAVASKVVIIHPSVDIYAHGEDPGGAFSWPQLKFDISGTPPGTYVASAKLWLYGDYASSPGWWYGYGEAWNGYVELFRVDDQAWTGSTTPAEFDAQTLTHEQIYTGKFMEDDWDHLNVTNQLKVDHDSGNAYASFRLRNGSYDTSWILQYGDYLIIDDNLLEIMGGEGYELRAVRLRSNEYEGYEPYLEVIYTTEVQEAEVLISPSYASAQPGETLTYAVMVINLGDVEVTYSLEVTDSADWGPSISPTQLTVPAEENRTAILSVIVPEDAIGLAEDNICVTAIGAGISESSTCVARAAVVRSIGIAISPSYKDGLPGMALDYVVTVRNEGNVQETYVLTVNDNSGWGLALLENLLENVQLRENRAVTLSVTIPENLIAYVEDEVNVTAASGDDPTIVASSSCIAKHEQWAKFKLENLYKVSLDVQLYLREGSKLIVEFYTYEENYQAETVVWSGTTPAHVIFLENVPHPENKPVEVARLVLVDEDDNVISIIGGFVVCRNHLWKRYLDIIIRWSYASEEERIALQAEMDAIKEQWPRAPDKKVRVSISPSYQENLPGKMLSYTVRVRNTGDFTTTYALVTEDNAGWEPVISPPALMLPVGVSGTATLSVTIPENTPIGTVDNVTVTAISTVDPTIGAKSTCIAHAAITCSAIYKSEASLGGDLYKSGDNKLGAQQSTAWVYRYAWARIGQMKVSSYCMFRTYLSFDTSLIPDDAIVTKATLHVKTWADYSNADFDVQVVGGAQPLFDSLDAGDWGCGSDNKGNIINTAEMTVNSWYSLGLPTSDINKAGRTQYELRSSREFHCDIATDNEYIFIYSGNHSDRPYLEVVYILPPYLASVLVTPSYQHGEPGETLSYTVTVKNIGLFSDNYTLTAADNENWGLTVVPSSLAIDQGESGTATLSVAIPENAAIGTKDNVRIIATSTENAQVSAESACIAHAAVVRGVDVFISPENKSGSLGATLSYTVTVKNIGLLSDNYTLTVSDNVDWNPTVSPTVLNLAAGTSEIATLSVTIPENTVPCTEDLITVIATSQADNTVSDNASCIAHAKEIPLPSIIAQGDGNAHNEDQEGDSPWRWYGAGDYPPLMAAKRIGAGAVVASGTASTCRDTRWNNGAATAKFDVLLDKAFQWMVPGAAKVLWFEGYGVYNDASRCSQLVTALRDKGYTVTGVSTTPITSSLLAPYDILVLPQLELGDKFAGGDPGLLPNADVEAIKSFVEGGKGLLIMEGSDYAGYNFYRVQNKILDALNFGLNFQHDEVEDPDFWEPYWFDAEVTDGGFGINYRTATGLTKVRLYGVCSLAEPL